MYLFATAALVALFWAGPRYAQRQSQMDRHFEGRQYAAAHPSHVESPQAFATPGDKLRILRPLGYGLAVALAIAWGRLWWQRFHRPRRESPS